MDEMEAIHFAFGKSRVSLLAIVQGVLSSGAVLVVALWISAALERKVLRDAVQDLSLRKVAASAIRATLMLVGILFALSAVGVDLTALSVLGGALGVGIGFGLQKLAANYVSGFVILFERSLRIGDTVRVDNFEGVVADIKTRYTLIRSLSGRESIVPNEKLITERIENLSLADPRILLTTDVAVGYDSDVDRVQRSLLDAARACAACWPTRSRRCGWRSSAPTGWSSRCCSGSTTPRTARVTCARTSTCASCSLLDAWHRNPVPAARGAHGACFVSLWGRAGVREALIHRQ